MDKGKIGVHTKDKNEEEILQRIKNNISYLRGNGSYQMFKNKTNVPRSTIWNYENSDSKPSVYNLKKIADSFEISLDDLINKDFKKIGDENFLKMKKYIPSDSEDIIKFNDQYYQKFIDRTYYFYYFNTSTKNKDKLEKGKFIVTTNNDREVNTIDAIIFNEDYEDSEYIGTFLVSNSHIYIYLKGKTLEERALIIAKAPPRKKYHKPYIGGLGSIVSISTGPTNDPCMQKLLISRVKLPIEDIKQRKTIFSYLDLKNKTNNVIRIDNDINQEVYEYIKGFYKNIN